ncbi:MAG: ABC transporter substrate-binding protein [Clostridia bacterium]|nr:ABC transporter substrate-binding protein [Clostridia bacterium]
MKKIIQMLLVLVLVFSLVACNNNTTNEANNVVNKNVTVNNNESVMNENEDAKATDENGKESMVVTITDGMGREIVLDNVPQTVVSLAPSMTEMIFALGLGDHLVGRTDYCNYPEEVASIESIGSLRTPNIEGIIALNPDLILMSTHASEEAAAMFDEAGIPYAVLTAQENFDGVYSILTQLGQIFAVEDEANEIITSMQSDVQSVVDALKDVEKKSVYYVVGFGEGGDWTATGDTFIHEMLEMAGGANVAGDATGWSYNLETLIEKDPDYIIVSELVGTKESFETTEGYKDLRAVKEGHLYTINQDLLSRQGPRLASGLKAIVEILHPEVLK